MALMLVNAFAFGGVMPFREALAQAVAARVITRGSILSSEDISIGPDTVDRTSRPVEPGWVARRRIQPGEPLRPPTVAPAPLVRSGQPVQFAVDYHGIRLTLPSKALSSGALGDTILVRLDSRRRFRAVVTGPGFAVATSDPTRH
jgi:flagella basal body P-ring formation protein FlgA